MPFPAAALLSTPNAQTPLSKTSIILQEERLSLKTSDVFSANQPGSNSDFTFLDFIYVHFRSYSHLNFLSHFSKSLTPRYPIVYEGTYQLWYLVFSVEVVVEGSETFSSVAAAICSTDEVLNYQSNINQCYSVA